MMAVKLCEKDSNNTLETKPSFTLNEKSLTPFDRMLNYLAKREDVYFKSQQIGEPELTFVQKRKIAEDLLSKNSGQFLARFGQFLQLQHLKCFDITNEDGMDYEVQYYLKQLKRFHNKSKMRVVIKNRRYEALKKLVNEGTYFSDEEMKKRNPLLYDRLVGCYLSGLEIHDQHLQAMSNIKSLTSLFLAQMDRNETMLLRQKQIDAEAGAVEEMDTSDEDSDQDSEDSEESSKCSSDYDRWD